MIRTVDDLLRRESFFTSPDKSHYGCFLPRGNPSYHGKRINPTEFKSSDPPYCATLLVGFNVGPKPKWKMNHLITAVNSYLRQKDLPLDASYGYQKGVFTHSSDKGEHVVTENSARITILRLPYSNWMKLPVKPPIFQNFCFQLAEYLCDKLIQKIIIVTISKGGEDIETRGMTGFKPLPKDLWK